MNKIKFQHKSGEKLTVKASQKLAIRRGIYSRNSRTDYPAQIKEMILYNGGVLLGKRQ